jgi:hypothetical protein
MSSKAQGNTPWMPLHYCVRGGVQIASAGVVAEPAPECEDLILGLRRQDWRYSGKRATETRVVREDRRDLRLLQHDL